MHVENTGVVKARLDIRGDAGVNYKEHQTEIILRESKVT